MRKKLTLLWLLLACVATSFAAEDVVRLQFNRTGTNAESVTVNVLDAQGNAISGATATLTSSHDLKGTANAVTAAIVCPNVNGNTSPTIQLTFTVKGLPAGFSFNKLGLHIHALNGGSSYQETGDGVTRQWNVSAAAGSSDPFASLSDIDIAAGISGAHKMWEVAANEAVAVEDNGNLTLTLTITKGTTNKGCFFGLSEVALSTANEPAPEPEPEPEPEPDPTPDPEPSTPVHEFSADKVYYISWKNTGANFITESKSGDLSVTGKNSGKMQFWKLVPTSKSHCYHIQNVVTGNYIGSCNKTPGSSSRVTTSASAVEYYVGATAATSGENAGCYYFSSTDCANYANESKEPRALNKDGASDYIITWTALTDNVGSYWKLIETTDTFVKPQHTAHGKQLNVYFNPCGVAGNNFLTEAKVHGEGALDHIVYEADSKPASWHVPYPHDHGQVVRGAAFDISIALKNTPAADLKANAYFDWNGDGEFEATTPITLDGTAGKASVTVPATATEERVRMRIRINSNGLDLADDDVEGFAYDFNLTVVEPQEGRTVSVGVNAPERGTATLNSKADSYAFGSQLTAKATPKGTAVFVCWREEGVVVSTEPEYTFTVDRNVKLKAYFSPNTDPDAGVEPLVAKPAHGVSIAIEGDNLVAKGNTEVRSMSLYTIEAALVAHAKGSILPIAGIAQGTYIVRANTAAGYENVKIYLNR